MTGREATIASSSPTSRCGVRYGGRGRHRGATVEQTFWKVFTLKDGKLLSMIEFDSSADAIASARAAAARG